MKLSFYFLISENFFLQTAKPINIVAPKRTIGNDGYEEGKLLRIKAKSALKVGPRNDFSS